MFSVGPSPIEENVWDTLCYELGSADSYGHQWNHFAIVKDEGDGTIKIYHNGILTAIKDDASGQINGVLAGQTIMELSPGMPEGTEVLIDELKIFNRTLTHEEIVYLSAGAASSVIQPINPLLTTSDLHEDGEICLDDFTVLAQGWLVDNN
jgi:hypothetical protein